MPNWTKSGLVLLLIVCAAPWTAPAAAAEAETDSLVWYVEQLEHDLALAEIRGNARADTLQIRVDLLNEQLAWAREDRRRWYHDPRIWFLVGAGLGVWVAGQAARATF